MIKLAVFGAGRIGYVHALNAASLPSVKLEYVVDPVPSAHLTDLIEKTGARVVDAETVFADPSIHGVIIASSTDTHADLILKSVAAAKSLARLGLKASRYLARVDGLIGKSTK